MFMPRESIFCVMGINIGYNTLHFEIALAKNTQLLCFHKNLMFKVEIFCLAGHLIINGEPSL